MVDTQQIFLDKHANSKHKDKRIYKKLKRTCSQEHLCINASASEVLKIQEQGQAETPEDGTI